MDSADHNVLIVSDGQSGERDCSGPVSWNMASYCDGNLIFPVFDGGILCYVYRSAFCASGVFFRAELSVVRSGVRGTECDYVSGIWTGIRFGSNRTHYQDSFTT